MVSDVFVVAEKLVSHIKTTCRDEVDLVAYYGSHAQGVATEHSDLDFFYVPSPGYDPAIARSFLLAGRLFDFWPLSWQGLDGFATGIARGWAFAPALVYHAQVLYARSDGARAHLAELKERVKSMQQEAARPEMVRRALGKFADVQAQVEELRQVQQGDCATLSRARWLFVESLWECLALANQVFFHRGLHQSLTLVERFELRPANMEGLLETVISSSIGGKVVAACEELARDTRQLLVGLQQSLPALSIGEAFKGAYPEFKDALNKVVAACRAGQRRAALAAAWSAQRELDSLLAATLHGAVDRRFNRYDEVAAAYRALALPQLLADDVSDLDALAIRVARTDEILRTLLATNGVDLNEFADLGELERAL